MTLVMTLAADVHYLLPPAVPTAGVALLAVAGLAAWAACHHRRFTERVLAVVGRNGRWLMAPVQVLVGFLALLAVAQLAHRGVLLATNWPIWPIALGAAVAVEGVGRLYRLERRTVSRRAGLALSVSRGAAVLLAAVMLAQPVLLFQTRHTERKQLAVLLDESASMHVPDTQMTPAEKVRLAEAMNVQGFRRDYPLDRTARRLRSQQRALSELAERYDALSTVSAERRNRQLVETRDELRRRLQETAADLKDIRETIKSVADGRVKLPGELLSKVGDARTRLGLEVIDRLESLQRLTRRGDTDRPDPLVKEYPALVRGLQESAAAAERLATAVALFAEAVDEALYASLQEPVRQRVDELARRQRVELARELLARKVADGRKAMLAALGEEFDLTCYAVARQTDRVSRESILPAESDRDRSPASRPTTRRGRDANAPPQPTTFPAELQSTDIAAGLQRVMTDANLPNLAGVVLFSEGQHNAESDLGSVADRLGRFGVPVYPVALGSQAPPTDAAVLEAEAPETVFAGDALNVAAKVKLDGLAGRTVTVSLRQGQRVLDRQTLQVPPGPSFRTQVQLSHEPEKPGVANYQVAIEAGDGEVLAENNHAPVVVSVTDQRVQLLMIEGRPRWEFRYLKNLFAARDRGIKLQYVLFEPDRVAGLGQPDRIVAAAGLPPKRIQATALPAEVAEWLKFDVIILGDVAPEDLGPAAVDALETFVADRGGTLIVIAGPLHMPMAYRGTPLEALLPVRLSAASATGGAVQSPIGDDGFAFALTAAGRDHVVTRQAAEPERNQAIWGDMPPMYWRWLSGGAKPTAEVLAYAHPANAPAFLAETPAGAPADEGTLARRRRYWQQQALLAVQPVGLGRVMALTFDRTWRFRYRTGDLYHHKFWGQVMRWATAGKLPAGTENVKLGTDRARYGPGERVTVRARLVQDDLTPVVSESVMAEIYSEGKLVHRTPLNYQSDSPGLYVGQAGPFEPGSYRVRLTGPAVGPLLPEDQAEKVVTDFGVLAAVPAEQAELAADRGALGHLATLTGGTLLDAWRVDELPALLGSGLTVQVQRRQHLLWNQWWYLLAILAVLTAEWLLRKKVGLA